MRVIVYLIIFLAFVFPASAQFELGWAKQFGGPNWNGMDMKSDDSGYVYIVGQFLETHDCDPGPAQHILSSNGLYDGFILKLDSAGKFVWARSFGGEDRDRPKQILIDSEGDLLISGIVSTPHVDLDPGPGVFYFEYPTEFVMKYDRDGNFKWAKPISGRVAVDKTNNIYSTALGDKGPDTDWGQKTGSLPNTHTKNSLIHKYNSNGELIWSIKVVYLHISDQYPLLILFYLQMGQVMYL
jgi:hypothetical protein